MAEYKYKIRGRALMNQAKDILGTIIMMTLLSSETSSAMGTEIDQVSSNHSSISVQNEWFIVNGERFFVKAVGYAGWRPHQWPGTDSVDLELVDRDFQLIKGAGFNTIRSWAALSDKELSIAEKYDLMVIQGIWIDPNRDFSDMYFIEKTLSNVREQVIWSSKHKNILMYLVITEPMPQAVVFAGEKATLDFFQRLKKTIQAIDPKPVSMDSWIPIGFLDHSLWDVVTFNAFMFVPEGPNRTLGFREYVKWLKETHSKNKPFFVGETGGFSVSKKRIGNLPFGGNTEEEQSHGNLTSLDECIAAGATGVCLVAWIDTWHYPSNPNQHDDEPWEWDGILGIPDDKSITGTPREIYSDLKKYNRAIIIAPHSSETYSGEIELQIYAEDSVGKISYVIDGGMNGELQKNGKYWWYARWDSAKVSDGKHLIQFYVSGREKGLLTKKEVVVFTQNSNAIPTDNSAILSIETDKKIYEWKESPAIHIRFNNYLGEAIPDQEIDYALLLPVEWQEEYGHAKTDERGLIEIKPTLQPTTDSTHLIVFAGTSASQIGSRRIGTIHFIPFRYTAKDKPFPEGPFYIYHDKGYPGNHYYYSGWMGDRDQVRLEDGFCENPYSGRTTIKISYQPQASEGKQKWVGVYWQEPLNNWAIQGKGCNLKGATRLTFWARGEEGGEKILRFSMGGVNGLYPDSDEAVVEGITLTKEWKQYTIDLKGKNLENICTGFGWVTNQILNPKGCTFYLDEICYEAS